MQSTYHGRGQKCASVTEKLHILRERMRGNQETASKLAAELKRREQELLSLATIKVCSYVRIPADSHLSPMQLVPELALRGPRRGGWVQL